MVKFLVIANKVYVYKQEKDQNGKHYQIYQTQQTVKWNF